MRNKMKTKIISSALVVALATGSMISSAPMLKTTAAENSELTATAEPTAEPTVQPTAKPTAKPTTKPTKKPTDKYERVTHFYTAKGEPVIFKDVHKGKIKIISSAGNKYKVIGNKIKMICKKSGDIKYQINGKKICFTLLAGGNKKDSKLTKKEYNLPFKWKGKKYKNYIDAYRDNRNYDLAISWDKCDKESKKFNRGLKIGSNCTNITKKYSSWEDFDWLSKKNYAFFARYYDKVCKRVFYKYATITNKGKITEITWSTYKINIKSNIYKIKY